MTNPSGKLLGAVAAARARGDPCPLAGALMDSYGLALYPALARDALTRWDDSSPDMAAAWVEVARRCAMDGHDGVAVRVLAIVRDCSRGKGAAASAAHSEAARMLGRAAEAGIIAGLSGQWPTGVRRGRASGAKGALPKDGA